MFSPLSVENKVYLMVSLASLHSVQCGRSGTVGLSIGIIKIIPEGNHEKIKHFIDREVHSRICAGPLEGMFLPRVQLLFPPTPSNFRKIGIDRFLVMAARDDGHLPTPRMACVSNDIEYSFEGIIDLARNLQSLVLDSTGLKSLEGVGLARSLRELNVLSGPLPSWLKNLPVLETFVAAHNDFDGPLFDFSKSESLIFLDLSSNRLSGPVPPTFLQSSNSEEKIFVNLSDNQLTGTVPGDLDRLDCLSIHLIDNQIQGMDDALCTAGGWNDNDVKSYGCDGILCPAGTYNPVGHQSYDESACEPCKRAKCMRAFRVRRGKHESFFDEDPFSV